MSAEDKARLTEATRRDYQKRYNAPILAHTDDEIYELCEQVVIGAPPDRDVDRVSDSVLTAIWMSPREATARLRATR